MPIELQWADAPSRAFKLFHQASTPYMRWLRCLAQLSSDASMSTQVDYSVGTCEQGTSKNHLCLTGIACGKIRFAQTTRHAGTIDARYRSRGLFGVDRSRRASHPAIWRTKSALIQSRVRWSRRAAPFDIKANETHYSRRNQPTVNRELSRRQSCHQKRRLPHTVVFLIKQLGISPFLRPIEGIADDLDENSECTIVTTYYSTHHHFLLCVLFSFASLRLAAGRLVLIFHSSAQRVVWGLSATVSFDWTVIFPTKRFDKCAPFLSTVTMIDFTPRDRSWLKGRWLTRLQEHLHV